MIKSETKDLEKIYEKINSEENKMVEFLGEMIKIRALDPRSGGEGEYAKAKWLENELKKMGFKVEWYNCPDDRVPSKVRPSLVVREEGNDKSKTLWIVTHTDIVPEGDLKKWNTDPYKPFVKDGKIFGRGVEDNGQELVASLFALKSLKELGIKPKINVALAFVADEETGSEKGIKYLIEKKLFKKEDLIVVPDGGNSDGTLVEVAEKSIAWIKFTIEGKQSHASMPHLGKNAMRAGMRLGILIDEKLHEKFSKKNELFDPPLSTFEPTKKEANVPNINTIPGEDVFYFDCRVLPEYKLSDVMSTIEECVKKIEKEYDVKVRIEKMQFEDAAPTTPVDAPVVKLLIESVKKVYKNQPKPGGIGGGTCAAIFRRAGYNAVVWAKLDDTCHGPNEYAIIDNLIGDAKVYATMMS